MTSTSRAIAERAAELELRGFVATAPAPARASSAPAPSSSGAAPEPGPGGEVGVCVFCASILARTKLERGAASGLTRKAAERINSNGAGAGGGAGHV
jgi:hypothetical protein